MKDDLFYVQPIVEYAILSDYNHVSKMDFPKRKQPSSMFPTLPDVSPVVPLDALTHHTDMNYPTVNHAYGPFHRPKYYIGKCPSNQFVRNFDTPSPSSYLGQPTIRHFEFESHYDTDDIFISKSKIDGNGLFAGKDFENNSKLFTAIDKNRIITNLGRYINHCTMCNTYLKYENDEYNIYSKRNIDKGEELTANYDLAPSFIKKSNKDWTC